MAFNLGGGYAAGAGADALESLWQLLAQTADMKQRRQMEGRRIDQEQQRLNEDRAYREMAQQDRAAAAADAAETRKVQRGTLVAKQYQKGQDLPPESSQALRDAHLGGLIVAPTLGSTNITGDMMRGQLRMAANPGRGETFAGTAEQAAAEQARQDAIAAREQSRRDRLDSQAQSRQDKIDAAAAAQQGREDLARLTASLHGSNADLQRELLQGKVDAAKDKATEKQQAVDTARNAALASIDDTSSALDELIDPQGNLKSGVGGAVGFDRLRSVIPGTSAADAKARIDRLQSRLTIDLLGEMKRQSRTGASGFGALSEKELAVLQNAAARLGTSQSDESFRQALVDIRKQLMGMRQRASGGAPSPGGTPQKETPEQRIQRLLGGG